MKRILAACLCQLIHFSTSAKLPFEEEKKAVQEEYLDYKLNLDRTLTKYKILKELPQKDGSLIIEIRKEYAMSPVGSYLS